MTDLAADAMSPFLDLGADLVARAKAAGADAAEAVVIESRALGASVRLGKVEDIEREESRDMGLRVFIGQQQATVSTTDFTPGSFGVVVDRAVARARAAPPDPYTGLADPDRLATSWPDLDLFDPVEPAPETLIEAARAAEDAGRAVAGVTNSDGAGASFTLGGMALVTSGGFAGAYRATGHALHASLVAGKGTGMERDYDVSRARHAGDLRSPEEVGREAAQRAVRRLNPRKAKSARVPVVYDPRVASSLIGHLAGAVNGTSVARKTSFLRARLGQKIFRDGIRITDDPHRVRGLGAHPFDSEGVATGPLDLVADGVLETWLLDTASARQLGLRTNGRARRGVGSPPSPGASELYLHPGAVTPKELMSDIASGLYVTELIGMGVNGVTGDYSRGAAGFWIENGEIAYPVSEITVAGNLVDMFAALTPADDLVFRNATNAPTVRIEGMTVAGA
ncbi:MAG: metallopeptidase TldD-related protein [Alphaproteobacteria bacterium]|nr:metallopeptidase TldD-related protein [Alphaproteobacteria bacterium]MDX5368221.1 metallopeptidase TldD-related protein [Alphaproteobacteria bacterium]MDX5463030.1 metallopeptidase TldD-related protein [Alphaproteobacteria bacterium]